MMINKLLLQTGGEIPFLSAGVTIHNPSLKEIGFIGDKDFLIGCHFLCFNRNTLSDEDKISLENKSDFEIFMSVMLSKQKVLHKTDAIMVLALLFPQYEIKIQKDRILLQSEKNSSSINEQNYEDFKNILNQMFCLEGEAAGDEYNPADALAAKIAEKIKKGKMKRKNIDIDEDKDWSIYEHFISVLAVGLQKSKKELSEYTVYQIRDEFQRYIKKENYDTYVKAKLAGAQDLEEVENWMDKIHP
jgi:hypothetical protein